MKTENTLTHYKVLQANSTELDTHVGLLKGQSNRVAQELSKVLADTSVLLFKTLNAHWNAVGPLFFSIHKLTEEQYTEMFSALDDLAERIRMLGQPAPGSMKAFLESSNLDEVEREDLSVEKMIAQLVADNEQMVINLRKVAELAGKVGDVKTEDMLVSRIGEHGKHAWMLKSTLAQ